MRRVRPTAVSNAVALDLTAREVEEVEARLARGSREVGDADRVPRVDLVLIERSLGAGEQLRINAGGSRGSEKLLRLRAKWRQRIASKRLRPVAPPRQKT